LKEEKGLVCSLQSARLVQKIHVEAPEAYDRYREAQQDPESPHRRDCVVVFAFIRVIPSGAIGDIELDRDISQVCYC
jgi:hypothetical protein